MLWVRHLNARDLPHLVKDLAVGAAWSIRHRDLERLRGEWAAWKSTAEVYADPQLVDLLRARVEDRRSGQRGTPIEEIAAEVCLEQDEEAPDG